MIPATLAGWTHESIVGLLVANVYEDTRFDWKEALPRGPGADQLIKNAVGMANGAGGFLVFGVANDPRLGVDRIVGVQATQEVPKELGELLRKADPHVPFAPLQPPIAVPGTDRVICVVEVLTGRAPHAYEHIFYKRTPRGADTMTTDEVKDMFIRREGQVARIRLLLIELVAIHDTLLFHHDVATQLDNVRLRRLDTRLLAELQADLAPLLGADPDLMLSLSRIRFFAEVFNAEIERALAYLGGGGDFHIRRSDSRAGQVVQSLQALGYNEMLQLRNLVATIAGMFGIAAPPFSTVKELYAKSW